MLIPNSARHRTLRKKPRKANGLVQLNLMTKYFILLLIALSIAGCEGVPAINKVGDSNAEKVTNQQLTRLLPTKTPPNIRNGLQCKDAKIVKFAGPAYPRDALRVRQEGWVVLGFDLSKEGAPINARLIDSSPAGIFEEEALTALKKSRYIESSSGYTDCGALFKFVLK